MDKVKQLVIAEAFYSIQGEGMTTGRPSIFIRLAGCNLMCGGKGTEFDKELHNGATWRCDTIEVWRQGKSMSHAELIDEMDKRFYFKSLLKKNVRLVITGGEPLLQQEAIVSFLKYIRKELNEFPYVEIETNGTIEPSDSIIEWADQFNVSPKLNNSGESKKRRLNSSLKSFTSLNSQFKFVIGDFTDLHEVIQILRDYKIETSNVWLMPAASTKKELKISKEIIDFAKMYGYNYSHRLHIEIYDQKTGV